MTDQPTQVPDVAVRRVGRVRGAVRRVLRLVPHPPLRSKRGLFVLFLLVAGFGSVVTVGGVFAVHYTETSSFCGRCHTMAPELKAYAQSPHKELTCAECHVEPGVKGWVKAKVKGTKQLVEIVTGRYPRPIPPPDHSHLPAVTDTCLKCHSLEDLTRNGGPVKLILRTRHRDDKQNTRELVAVVLRPAGLGQGSTPKDAVLGVHWHVSKKVTYSTPDSQAQKIDLVQVEEPDGTTKQYLAGAMVGFSATAATDIQRVLSTQRSRVMDCLACHNRVGHAVPSIEQAVDESIAAGRISADLPFVKRDAVALLDADYPTFAAADAAIEGLRDSVKARFPLVSAQRTAQLDRAVEELKLDYRLVATPDMKVQARTYPNNLGHLNAPGCFRCHDGAHFLVVKGKVSTQTIPSTCATCHTFPQVGGSGAAVLVGGEPASHDVKNFVFGHRSFTTSIEPGSTSCGTCHVRSYCVNCHESGAVKVRHQQMLFSHATAVKKSGLQACAACHQPSYCATCHKKPLLVARPP